MSYNNYFSLKVLETPKASKSQPSCPTCNEPHQEGDKFCSKDGSKLVYYNLDYPILDVISKFREFSDEANSFLANDGSSGESGSGHNIVKDLIKFSIEYPNGLFQLGVEWDSGFGDPPSRYYIKNGKSQSCTAEYKFEKYDEMILFYSDKSFISFYNGSIFISIV